MVRPDPSRRLAVPRPLVVIPARFSQSASALRYRAVVNARALSEAVLRAGGEPLTVHPWAPDGIADPAEVADRMAFADAVLLPGGGDLAPSTYGATSAHDEVYDVDPEQDAFDLAVAAWAFAAGVPVLAICRGAQVVNVALGGALEQHMDEPHRHHVDTVSISDGALAGIVGASTIEASCYHHQCITRLGAGLEVAATAVDGTVEAVAAPARPGWFVGVQWHPEDTAHENRGQQALFDALVAAARA
jgi:putative glutamine amidotransferase